MGFIDKTTYTLSCPNCGVDETASILDKGSNWGGPSWQYGAKFAKFESEWSGGGQQEPELVSASCKSCGTDAIVKSSYGGI